MSDLSVSLQALERSRAQLPVSSYFDVGLFETEQSRIFKAHPRYLGHSLSVPEVGDYQALTHEGEGRVLVRNAQGVQLLSNVCRHRQAVMLKGRGHTGSHIVCPLHRWTYSNQGQLVGAPHFSQDPCLNLRNFPVQEWNGLVFERAPGQMDVGQLLSGLGVGADLDFTGYQFHSAQLHECNYNWKTFIEVYLEDYHVVPFHPGLGGFVECEDLRWEFGQHHSVQTVGVRSALARPGSEVYRKWHDAVLSFGGGEIGRAHV